MNCIAWIKATRPKTLIASIFPVSIGASLAISKAGEISILVFILCLVFSLLIQVATNLLNDYFDFLRGADRDRSIAPNRFVSSGDLNPKSVRNVSYLILSVSFATGIVILQITNGPIELLWVGIVSVACAVLYTGGPFPLAYNALGDIFVLIFYGFIAVEVTHYVLLLNQAVQYSPNYFAGLSVGCMTNLLLVTNNYRDYQEDEKNEKKTLIVVFGRKFGFYFYLSLLICSLCVCPILDPSLRYTIFCLPFGIMALSRLHKAESKRDFDTLLSLSAFCLLFSSILTITGIILEPN